MAAGAACILALGACGPGPDAAFDGTPTTPIRHGASPTSAPATTSAPTPSTTPPAPTPSVWPTPGDAAPQVAVTFVDDEGAVTDEVRATIRRRATDVAAQVSQALPALPPTLDLQVRVAPADQVTPATGEAATMELVDGRPTVAWRVDPTHEGGVAGLVEERLACVLAHEWHHQARGWILGADVDDDLVSRVVAEGLATAFARDLTGCAPPWAQYGEDVVDWAPRLRQGEDTATRDEWMLDHPGGGPWLGYRIGTWWADQAAIVSHTTPAELVHADAAGIGALADLQQGELPPDEWYPVVLDAELTEDAGAWTVAVTLSSPYDRGDQYADAFRVTTPDGASLGVRELTHPHEQEQPFTRSLRGVQVPDGTVQLEVTGRDSVNGWAPTSLTVDVPPG